MRTCDTCHECCVQVKVDAFDKPAGVPCHQLTVLNDCGSCGCYERRPDECKAYTCSWLDGYGSEDMRPDKCGILLETARIEHPKTMHLLMGFEHEPGAMEKYADQLAAAATAGVVVVLIPHDQGTPVVFAQLEDALAFQTFMQACQERGGITHVMNDGTFEQSLPGN